MPVSDSNFAPPTRSGPRAGAVRLRQALVLGSSVFALAAGWAGAAAAQCTAGDGQVTTTGVCNTQQTLTTSTGTVVAGATLSTGAATAYIVAIGNASLANSGTIASANS